MSIAVGSLLVTYEWSDWRNGAWWWIQSVYVMPDARRGGVFRSLHGEVAKRARATHDVIGLRLYVEQHNERAQATYRGLGMQRTHYQLFEDEFAQSATEKNPTRREASSLYQRNRMRSEHGAAHFE